MKLLTRYNRANIVTAIIILLVSSASYYFIIRYILLKQIDKDLMVEEQEINDYIKENNALPRTSDYKGQQVNFQPSGLNNITREITSSNISDNKNHHAHPVRMLAFPVTAQGIFYKAMVIKSQVEAESLVKVIVLVTAFIFLLLLAVISLVNRLLLGKLWQPFYHTLMQLKSYDIKRMQPLALPSTEINEFTELNQSVNEMTHRVSNDFEALKSFTDNASHEMQTPLAIINSKLDILLQNSNENQADQLQAIYNATGRLSRLNQTLLLLTKINNDQYKNQSIVNVTLLLQQKMHQFEELIKAKEISCSLNAEEVSICMNKELADILLNNLLSNAIRHNYAKGFISCELTKEKLSITNWGPLLTFDKKQIFDRFQKSDHSEGTGLGLAVAEQICQSSGMKIMYFNKHDEHTFEVFFQS